MFLDKAEELTSKGYCIENARIQEVRLTFEDHGVLTLDLVLEGRGWGCCFGGYVLGHGYIGAKEFSGSANGIEAIMRVMDTIGVHDLLKAKGMYVRAAFKRPGSQPVEYIGNVIQDKWFGYKEFFEGKEEK